VKAEVISVISGAIGTISKSDTAPEQHTEKARNQGTTKTAILDIAHILRKVLISKYIHI
jgi:hypothetical protein